MKKHSWKSCPRWRDSPSHLPPEIILRTINEDFRSFNNNSLQGDDDITFLVMQVEPENNKKWIFVLESSFEELTPLRRQVREFLPGFEKKELFIACLHELVVNAIEHGNRFDRAKKVSVEIVITDHDVVATVEDEGGGSTGVQRWMCPLSWRETGRGVAA